MSQILAQTGDILNARYRIMAKLGGGASGIVYKVDDLQSRNSDKVVKLAFKQFVGRHEAEVLQKLSSSPYAPTFFEMFNMPPNKSGIVMSNCGESISALLKKKRSYRFLDCNVVRALHDVYLGLEKLHNSGYIHRDIKTANICIAFDNKPRVRIVDFGMTLRKTCYASTRSHDHTERAFKESAMSSLQILDGGRYSDFDDATAVLFVGLSMIGQSDVFVGENMIANRKKKSKIEKNPKAALKGSKCLTALCQNLIDQRKSGCALDHQELRQALLTNSTRVTARTPFKVETQRDGSKNLK